MGDKAFTPSLVSRQGKSRLMLFGFLAGLAGAVPAIAYRYALSWADHSRAALVAQATSWPARAGVFVGILVLGLIVGLLAQKEPLISGSGIPQVEAQVHEHLRPSWLRVMVMKFVGGALSVLSGLSLGREGPSIQLGAMAAQGMSEASGQSKSDTNYLVVCGASAGLAAAFNAPLAGVMFALEEIHHHVSAIALFPAMLAAVSADILSKLFFGAGPTLGFVALPAMPLVHYPLFLLMGIALGVAGALYNGTLLAVQKAYKRLPVPIWLRMLIPFAVAGLLIFVWPQVTGGGHPILEALWHGHVGIKVMALLLVGKFVFSMISFCSGAPGGIFFPLLVLGALIGSLFGALAVRFLGVPETAALNFMLMGMAGLFAGIVRAPLTGIILVVEMTGALTQLADVTIVAFAATLTANALKSEPIYESLLKALKPQKVAPRPGDNRVVTHRLPLGSPLDGRQVRDLALPEHCLIMAIERGGQEILPRGDSHLHVGDLLTIAVAEANEAKLLQLLDEWESSWH